MSLVLRKASRTSDEYQDAIGALNDKFNSYKSAAHIKSDADFVYTAGELIRQLAQDRFMMMDPTDLFFDRVPGPALGDYIEFEEWVNTAKVVERSLGGKPRTYTPHKNKYTMAPTDWRVDFGFELEQVATGQLDINIWVEQMAEAWSRYYVTTALGALEAATQVGVQDMYGNAVRTQVATAVDDATIDTALRRLGDVNPDVIIAGRYSALYPLFELTNSVNEVASEEFRQRGAIARFRGATIVVLRDNFNPFFGTADVPSDRIYCVGGEKGGLLAETDMSAMNYQTVDDEEQHFRVGTKGRTAFFVHKPWRYHMIEIT